MEQKNLKISLSAIMTIVAVIALVVAGVMTYFVINLRNEKAAKSMEIAELKGAITNNAAENNTAVQNEVKNEVKNEINNETKTETNNTVKEVATKKQYTFKELTGHYGYEDTKGNNGNGIYFRLILNENGTFEYRYNELLAGFYGNYTIDGDTIILNKWNSVGSDPKKLFVNGTIKFKINNDGSITGYNLENWDKTMPSVVLKKESTKGTDFDINKNLSEGYSIVPNWEL